MKPFSSVVLLVLALVLTGCASPSHPELRPYSVEETRQLAMESLNRSSLSFEEYHQKKVELLGSQQKTWGYDEQAEISVDAVSNRLIPQG